MVLNQNSSADRLGLNPTGTVRIFESTVRIFESTVRIFESHSLKQISFSKKILCLSEAHMDFVCPVRGRTLIEYLKT